MYAPQNILNLRSPTAYYKFYDASTRPAFKTIKLNKYLHLAFACFTFYSLVQAYRKSKRFRLVFIWLPLSLLVLAQLHGSSLFRFRFVRQLLLSPDGKSVTIKCSPNLPWQNKVVRVTDIQLLDRNELVQIMADKNMFLAKNNMLPFKIEKDLYAMDVSGNVENDEVLRAVLNGIEIDTSKSFD